MKYWVVSEGGRVRKEENFGKRKPDRIRISTGENTGNHGVEE